VRAADQRSERGDGAKGGLTDGGAVGEAGLPGDEGVCEGPARAEGPDQQDYSVQPELHRDQPVGQSF